MNIRTNSLCIIKSKNKILGLSGKDDIKQEKFIRLLGGGIDFGESSLIALKREFKEELDAEISKEKLLTVFENIFEFNGNTMHEITFLYSAEIEENFLNGKKFPILDSKTEKYAEWFSVDEIKNNQIKIYPEIAVNFL
jgi:ADP-ribose pyrophosphatase YjhB (NUDIX family)